MNRRKLITGLISLVAAPAIVRAETLMPITGETYRFWTYSQPVLPPIERANQEQWLIAKGYIGPNGRFYRGTWEFFGKGNIYTDQQVGFTSGIDLLEVK